MCYNWSNCGDYQLKNMVMKYNILIGLILLSTLPVLAQSSLSKDSYAVVNSQKVDNLERYRDALSAIDLDKYREDDKRRVLKFTTGVEIVLYSRNEMKKGHSPETASEVSNDVRILKLGPNGQIAEQAPQRDLSTSKPIIATKAEFPVDETLPNGFPVQTNSGNKLADQKQYQVNKQKWINENPEEYKQISSGGGATVISKSEYDQMSKEKQKMIRNSPDKYFIQDLK